MLSGCCQQVDWLAAENKCASTPSLQTVCTRMLLTMAVQAFMRIWPSKQGLYILQSLQ